MDGWQFLVIGFIIGMAFVLVRDICLCVYKIPSRCFVIEMYISYGIIGAVISLFLGFLWNFNS